MNKETKYDNLFMGYAKLTSAMSVSNRAKVGSILVKDHRILCNSWNGTVAGDDNNCERQKTKKELSVPAHPLDLSPYTVTKPEVVHAEINLISYCAKNGINTNNATMYITLSPCVECAKAIIQCGIKEVVYKEPYRDPSGLEFLDSRGIKTRQFKGIE